MRGIFGGHKDHIIFSFHKPATGCPRRLSLLQPFKNDTSAANESTSSELNYPTKERMMCVGMIVRCAEPLSIPKPIQVQLQWYYKIYTYCACSWVSTVSSVHVYGCRRAEETVW